ncbi:hypothetical protein SCP_0403120 [Sparassis crispa]|uniref:Nucleoporin n=1 Tax=Sparassis crispa TaxID=139825 RepID=A0A401GIF0_9APHY|nr:hypothetical protein SCP_0403120 [Sparassis crispa]GBE81938.1 hypothetical protein SCP_0403120 [Sparassis crispa]
MATFSPSPAPRPAAQRTSISHALSPPRQPVRRTRTGGSKPASRFATPARQERQSSVDGSLTSGMDVDDTLDTYERPLKAETLFAKSEELTATFYASLPVEVKHVLKNTDFYRNAYSGDIDTETGFALVASVETCFVWKYAQALSGTPTCYIFVCPRDDYSPPMTTVFHALVPYGASREPGLILVSYFGGVRFWDSIGMGLTGGETYSWSALDLQEDECVTTLTRSDPQTYIISTSAGRLYLLMLTKTGGKYHLTNRVFSRQQSALSFSRLWPNFLTPPSIFPDAGNINSIALGISNKTESARDVWAVIETRVQKWRMHIEGWEELLLDDDLGDAIRTAIREAFVSASQPDMDLDLELLDLKLESPSNLVILVSYAAQEDDEMETLTHPRRIYAIIHVRYGGKSFQVEKAQAVPYQSTARSGAPMHPRLQLMLGGQLVAIQFGDAVTICARDNDYMDRLALKSKRDRTLGVGVVEGNTELLILTAGTTMKAYIDMDQVARFDAETGRANLIKWTMTQAILYGSYPENPLEFSFPPEIDEEALMSGAEQLSQAIIQSDSDVVRPNHDLQAQIAGRKERLSWLIKFINDNVALPKMSQHSRQRLATDAEKLYAADQLWLQHSEFLGVARRNNVLSEAIYRYMNAVGESHHEDCVRAFFRLKVEDIGSVFPHLLQIVRNAAQGGRSLAVELEQANRIILTVLQSAINYREFNMGVYGVERPLIDLWSSKPALIDIISELFDTTARLVESPSPDSAAAQAKSGPRGQLPQLATSLFASIQERLEWLESPLAVEGGSARELTNLDSTFRQLRPEVLETLRRNGFADHAFRLAEDYRDFRSLASLCHKETVYPPQDNPNVARIQSYIGKFKEDFTNELYQWYIEHGELRTMFAQDHDEYLDTFFEEHKYPGISWIHDIGKGRYDAASESLLSEAGHSSDLMSKHLMLSIGKLSHLAQSQADATPVDQSLLDAFHVGLDFVDVHETLVDDLKSALATVRNRQSLEMQVETITNVKASQLDERRSLQNVFKQFVRQLLQGKALSPEDIADLLSLKDNLYSVEDYATALQLLSRAKGMPEARRFAAFKSVWRRIYIHDDWDAIRQTSNVTDAELNQRLRNTALYVALRSTLRKRHPPHGYILLPLEVVEIPDRTEISLRWPGMSPDEVEGVERDYRWESDCLIRLELDGMSDGMRTLVAEELGE